MTLTAAIYARVSTDEQHVENQLHDLRAEIAKRGWTSREFVDEGYSGATTKRPALDAMMAAVRAGEVGAVVVWRFDRFTRRIRHLLRSVDEFKSRGVAFVSLREQIDTTAPWGMLVLSVFGALAEYERESIRERVNAGLDRARREGKRFGRPPAAITTRRSDVRKRVQRRGLSATARELGVSRDALRRWLKK